MLVVKGTGVQFGLFAGADFALAVIYSTGAYVQCAVAADLAVLVV
ncbi:hypothetical protein SALWKB12_0551 [Snodgrassella communis]|uniref:Uncharacterized protein n=1 Tax=Snodgrassella communis TaxID=2946699 RepID=A0A066TA43_9NEIS|nr:hypothetical protein SALWKB12_2117 [Snodgrassella communis]KDN11806.1 hypothetical protein SALWKB12_1728 [Snodgrassella communis]KDN11971.1 hypothetical protein SALWKB12_1893 [Snodgrassella communis]KDN13696.1 hypothetical protein SALWKB12_0551 [Snodgrassella communis]KDN13723.1 hypothetical protein SALWKB29_2241 [Snodgrassella communis]